MLRTPSAGILHAVLLGTPLGLHAVGLQLRTQSPQLSPLIKDYCVPDTALSSL